MELVLFLTATFAATAPLVYGARRRSGRLWVVAVASSVLCLLAIVTWSASNQQGQKSLGGPLGQRVELFLPEFIKDEGFASSDACHSCHPGNYASWHKTFHRTMTQVATSESVLAPFDERVLRNEGIDYRVWSEGKEYWVELPDPDVEQLLTIQGHDVTEASVQSSIPRVKRRVVMTTGSHHMQGYWVASSRGRELLQIPWVFLIRDQRWLPYESVFLRPPDKGRRIALWNNSCIQCHSVDGNPKGTGELGLLFSDTVELGIACEACHGPGEDHIRRHRNPLARYWARMMKADDHDSILNPADCTADVSAQVCGQCHSMFHPQDLMDWWQGGFDYEAGDPLDESRHLLRFGEEKTAETLGEAATAAYWADGTMRVGGREYLAMIASPCFEHRDPDRQMSCLSCHSMHHADPNDQLAQSMDGNRACVQCHSSYSENIEQHTHHAPSSQGSQCYNCHMPHTSFALLKAMRTHRVVSPNVAASVEDGQPNGCNQCHLDKTLDWTAQFLNKWYDIPRPELTPDDRSISASVQWLLKGDAAQRAIAAWTFGWDAAKEASGDQWEPAILAQLLDDPYDVVRYVSFDSLRKSPGYENVDYDFIGSKEDRIRARRIVLEHWSHSSAEWRSDGLTSVLIDRTGLREEDVRRLQAQRNDRPVEFPE